MIYQKVTGNYLIYRIADPGSRSTRQDETQSEAAVFVRVQPKNV